MGSIHHEGFVGGCDRPVGHAFIIGSLLKVTVTIGVLAVHAEVVALAEDHRKDKLPRGFGLVCVGVNDHIITRRHNTRRLQGAGAFNFHQAEPAGAVRNQLGVITERGHIKTSFADCIQDRRTSFDFNGLSVNG